MLSNALPNGLATLLCLVCLSSQTVYAADKPPVLLNKLDPNEGIPKSGFVFDVADVELSVDQTGVPFAVRSDSGLPEYVVSTLQKWKYSPYIKNGRKVAFAVKLTIPVAKQLTPFVERNLFTPWYPHSDEIREAMQRGHELTDAQAAELAASLPNAEALGNPRTSLLVYYAQQGAHLPDIARAGRAKILEWLITNYPQDEILGSSFAIVNASGETGLADSVTAAKLSALWMETVKQHPDDDRAIQNAMNFFRTVSPEFALQYSRGKNLFAVWTGGILGLAAAGVSAIDPVSGRPSDSQEGAFNVSAHDQLLHSPDARTVLIGLLNLTWAGRALQANHHLTPEYDDFCPKLLMHAKELFPQTTQTCDTAPQLQDTQRSALVYYDEKTTMAKLTRRVQPKYPSDAKDRGIQGTVKFTAMINRSGEIEQLGLTEGNFVFYPGSLAAVKQWRYSPTLINGIPADVSTVITVNYTLSY